MTIFRSKLRMLHAAFITVFALSAAVTIKIEYFDSRPVGASVRRTNDVVIVVKHQALYLSEREASLRRIAIGFLIMSALCGVATGRFIRREDGDVNPWKRNEN